LNHPSEQLHNNILKQLGNTNNLMNLSTANMKHSISAQLQEIFVTSAAQAQRLTPLLLGAWEAPPCATALSRLAAPPLLLLTKPPLLF
jgi:hypothetical protein